MVRKHLLIITLISLCSGAHASVVKDTSRVAVGAGIGAASVAAVQATFKAVIAFVEQDSSLFPGIDYKFIRLGGVVGGTVGLLKTTYGRTLRAQWNTWWSKTSKELITLTLAESGDVDDARLVRGLELYFIGHSYPLVAAKRELSSIFAHFNTAAHLIEDALEDIDEDSLRAQELNDWLDEIYTVRARVAYAIDVIDNDPRILTLMDAQNRIDQTNALWLDAIANSAVAASKVHNNNK